MRKTFEMSALEKISLIEEVEFLKNYISLQGMRLNYLIKSRYEIDPALDLEVAEIPALMVQPLVENAILHGISPWRSLATAVPLRELYCQCYITISRNRESSRFVLSVRAGLCLLK